MMTKKKPVDASSKTLYWDVPKELGVPPDTLRLRLDFFHQAVEMTIIDGDTVDTRIVSAFDVATTLATSLSYGTGLLPENTLWWQNTRGGAVWAIYEPPRIRKVAILLKADKPPARFTIPMPGFIFLCSPGKPPWVYAVTEKPTKETDIVYKAPVLNVFENGRTCSGNNQFPHRVADIVENFFISFFSLEGDLMNRSIKYKDDVTRLWMFLNGKKKFPIEDLVKHGTVQDLMMTELGL
jgi:PRTRC genetic system protein B